MWRFHVLRCVRIRNFDVGKMRVNQGLSMFVGMKMEQRSKECGYNQQSHRVPRDQFSHQRIVTKRSSKVNRRPDRTDRTERVARSLSAQIESLARVFVWR